MAAKSALETKMETTPPGNRNQWEETEAAVELILDAIGTVSGGTGGTATAAKQDTGNTSLASILATAGATTGTAVITDVNGTLQQYLRGIIKLAITAGGWLVTAVTTLKQYTGVPSSFAIQTVDQTVFTLAAGEVGFIQNLSADAPLAVKKGASASTTSLNYILKASTAASDGTGGAIEIKDWVGVVSVAKMTGTASYLAWKQAP